MVKLLLNLLFVLLILSSLAFARNIEGKLKSEFGPDLTKAPFFLRFSFSREYGKDWKKSFYAERKAFLSEYENNLTAQQARDKVEAKAEAQKERDLSREKREADREKSERLKTQLAQERAEQEEYDQEQKGFNSALKDQDREIQQMQRQEAQASR